MDAGRPRPRLLSGGRADVDQPKPVGLDL